MVAEAASVTEVDVVVVVAAVPQEEDEVLLAVLDAVAREAAQEVVPRSLL